MSSTTKTELALQSAQDLTEPLSEQVMKQAVPSDDIVRSTRTIAL